MCCSEDSIALSASRKPFGYSHTFTVSSNSPLSLALAEFALTTPLPITAAAPTIPTAVAIPIILLSPFIFISSILFYSVISSVTDIFLTLPALI